MEEIWKGLIYQGVDYSMMFEVSNAGRIRNKKTGRILKQRVNKNGYYQISVSLGSRKNKKVLKMHKAVTETFIPNPNNLPMPNHKDGNKLNNCCDNLEWVTNAENIRHALQNKLFVPAHGLKHCESKLSREDVIFIKENYKPRDPMYGARPLGRRFNVEHGTILNIMNGKSYKDVA